ncbi:MAG: ribonuclease HII [Muribaculaceae bacterium]|nr:ribonuclease HII [Muribaculaceae bacterium]
MLRHHLIDNVCEAGCDEAGRGCLCGPVFAAAVILPPDFCCDALDDSKKLTEHQRDMLRPVIEREALAWAVATVSAREIDQINILNASILAMHRALSQLIDRDNADIGHIIVDGNRFKPFRDIPHTTVIKGDGKYMSIAAASILAKTYRDAEMRRLDALYPGYGWGQNMGYPTAQHREAMARLGLTPEHRRSYKTCKPFITTILDESY